MLYVNDSFYSADDYSQHFQAFDKLQLFNGDQPARIAVCLEDNALWLALCLYMKSQQASVMPIHPTTPLSAARRLAMKAGCQTLLYKDLNKPITLDVDTTSSTLASTNTGSLIQMSSGTTGDPKCIDRSWHAIDEEVASTITAFDVVKDMTPVIACPVTHSYGLISGVMVALARGLTPRIVTNINPRYLIKILKQCEKPLLYSSPTMLAGLFRLWPKDSSLHAVMTSGTIMTQQTFDQLAPRIDHLFQQYGCSEAGCATINQQMTTTMHIGSALPHLNVTAGESVEKADEIVITLNSTDPALNGQTIHTQDLGYFHRDDNGQPMMTFLSRMDDTIIVSGLNVYPQEVEDVILNHPHITDVVIFKMHDDYAGQRVGLQFVSPQILEASEIRQWCGEHLASYQLPQELIQVDEINRLANGKVNRKQIARVYGEQQALAMQTETSAPAL